MDQIKSFISHKLGFKLIDNLININNFTENNTFFDC